MIHLPKYRVRPCSYLSVITCLLLVFSIISFKRYLELSIKRPTDPVAIDFLAANQPPCVQRTDGQGYEEIDGAIRTYPRCLSVMNSRFGSRFNFDVLRGLEAVNSSVLGTLEDRNTGFSLSIDNIPLFPLHANSGFSKTSVDLGLTYERINFENEDTLVSMTITSPFSPSKNATDDTVKMSTAPFFYIDLDITNKTYTTKNHSLTLKLPGSIESQGNTCYLLDSTRKDGKLALSVNTEKLLCSQNTAGFTWNVKALPHIKQTHTSVYAGYLGGPILTNTSNINHFQRYKFAYTNWFKSIDDVIAYAWKQQAQIRTQTQNFEQWVKSQAGSPQRYWLLAQTFHSYMGNTFLAASESNPNQFDFFVWEGEFKYINTVDVAHDYAVLEGLYFPWVIKSELFLWSQSASRDAIGVVIPHDIGKRFEFPMKQTYGYLDMQPSAMPVEENANFLLLMYWYWHNTQDTEFVKTNHALLKQLVESLKARDINNNGIADTHLGITTYDNDNNLALLKASDGVYLGIKQLSSYLTVASLFQKLHDSTGEKMAVTEAHKIKTTIINTFNEKHILPLSLNNSSDDLGYPIIMGLLYPVLTQLDSEILSELKPIFQAAYPKAYRASLQYDVQNNPLNLNLASLQRQKLGWASHALAADIIADKYLKLKYQSDTLIFPFLYDNPYSYTDGISADSAIKFQTPVVFYPRGVVLFADLVMKKDAP